MASKVDSAIIKALGLDVSATSMARNPGCSAFSSTFKLSTTVDGKPRHFFVKTASGRDAEVMFKGKKIDLVPEVYD